VINCCKAQYYGPYENVPITAMTSTALVVEKIGVIPDGLDMIGKQLIADGRYYQIDEWIWPEIGEGTNSYAIEVSPSLPYLGERTFTVLIVPQGGVPLQLVTSSPDSFTDWNRPASTSLDMCQGDCNDDNDCQGNMKCFENISGDSSVPPGCGGSAVPSADYCYSPAAVPDNGNNLQWLGWDATDLTECQGDCDNDNDCQGNLVCFHEDKPGDCDGTVHENILKGDYCGNSNSNAAAVEGDEQEEFEGFEDDIEALTGISSYTVSAKDMVIMVLVVLNLVTMFAIFCNCMRSRNGGVVSMDKAMAGDSECEMFNNRAV